MNLLTERRRTGLRPSVLLGAATLLIDATAGSAAHWVPVNSHSRGDMLLDTDGIQRAGNGVTLWIKVRLPNPDPNGVYYEIDQWRLDCAEMTVATLRTKQYDVRGKALSANSLPAYYPEQTAIIPNSTGFDIYRMVCR